MAQEKGEGSRRHLAAALLCGLAIACTIMYFTADGDMNEDMVEEIRASKMSDKELDAWGKEQIYVESIDAKKVQDIITSLPDKKVDGKTVRGHLLDYFKHIEEQIAVEVSARKKDIRSIKIKMTKNMEINKRARLKMRSMLGKRMERNAKIAKHDLDKAMARTAKKFAAVAAFEKQRYQTNLKRSAATREVMRKNKAEAGKSLAAAVHNQQQALSALATSMNKKIHKTDMRISANAAHIKANAKTARDALDHSMRNFDTLMLNMHKEAKHDREGLQATAKSMDKKVRAMIAGKIKGIVAKNAANFQKVRSQMAKDRMTADAAVKAASQKMSAALNAQALLNGKRYKETQAGIAAAKAETAALLKKATTSFKVSLYHLKAVAKQQEEKLNSRVTTLQGVVASNKAAQAVTNHKVDSEMHRMVVIGNEREGKMAKKHKALSKQIAKNAALTEAHMHQMKKNFLLQLHKIQKTMKKDRAHHERELAKTTSKLYSTLAKNEAIQAQKNKAITSATTRAKLDAQDELRDAKLAWTKHLAGLTTKVNKLNVQHNKAVEKLTGLVQKNAIKDAQGRHLLRMMQKANKASVKSAIHGAVAKGEARAQQIEKMMKNINKKTRAKLNARVTQEITKLRKETHAGLEELRLNSPENRKAMTVEIRESLKAEAVICKKDLAATVKWAGKKFALLSRKYATKSTSSAFYNKLDHELKVTKRAIKDAVANQNRVLLSYKHETESAPMPSKKARVDAYALQLEKQAKDVSAQMKTNIATLVTKIRHAKIKASAHLSKHNKNSVRHHLFALNKLEAALKEAAKEAAIKFGKVFVDLAKARAATDAKLAASIRIVTDKIAKRSALYDGRFSKTVKNMKVARKAAFYEVKAAKEGFTTQLFALMEIIQNQETKLQGMIQVVAGEVRTPSAQKAKIGHIIASEIAHIQRTVDGSHVESSKYKGKVRAAIEQHRKVAEHERKMLLKHTMASLVKLKKAAQSSGSEAADDLETATRRLYGTLVAAQMAHTKIYSGLAGALAKAGLSASAAIKRSKEIFEAKLITMTNSIVNANVKLELGLQKITKVPHEVKYCKGVELKLLKDQIAGIMLSMNTHLVRIISLGEAKAKAEAERAHGHVGALRQAFKGEIVQRVEVVADKMFDNVKGARVNIADNFLALKAYCGAAEGKIVSYMNSGKGNGINAVGDLLQMIALLAKYRTKPTEGIGAGGTHVPGLFGGKGMTVSDAWTKTNGLVDEYTKIMTMVRDRWPYGIGHYLLGKIQYAMQKKGVLTVGKLADKSGEFVSVNAAALGLTNRLGDLEELAATAASYQAFLRKLTSKLPKALKKPKYMVPPPEWGGN